jgi:hypothetical protein
MQRTTEMITITMPWWAWVLYFLALGALSRIVTPLGDKLGRATYRRWRQHRDARLMEWSRRG